MTVQVITQAGLNNIGKTIETLSILEGLEAHAQAISVRTEIA